MKKQKQFGLGAVVEPKGQNDRHDTSKSKMGSMPAAGGKVNKSRNRGTKSHGYNVSANSHPVSPRKRVPRYGKTSLAMTTKKPMVAGKGKKSSVGHSDRDTYGDSM